MPARTRARAAAESAEQERMCAYDVHARPYLFLDPAQLVPVLEKTTWFSLPELKHLCRVVVRSKARSEIWYKTT